MAVRRTYAYGGMPPTMSPHEHPGRMPPMSEYVGAQKYLTNERLAARMASEIDHEVLQNEGYKIVVYDLTRHPTAHPHHVLIMR